MTYLILFLVFLKIGAFTFGGGYAMLPIIKSEIVSAGWMSEELLYDFIAVSESTPGPIAVNMATFVGFERGGVPGALLSTLGIALPAFAVMLIFSALYSRFNGSGIAIGIMTGIRPAVIGLIGAAALDVAFSVFTSEIGGIDIADPGLYVSLLTFVLCLALALKKKHPVLIIALAACLGLVSGILN